MINYQYPSKDPLAKLKNTMSEHGFNKRTIISYLHYIEDLIRHTEKSPRDLSADDIINYLEKLVREKKSRSTLNTVHSALKFYFEKILKRRFFAPHGKIERAKLDKKQPVTLSENEVNKIIKVSFNPKYKLIFELMHKTGLKSSEIVNIKLNNFDFSNNLIIIEHSDSNTERTIILDRELNNKIKIYIESAELENYLFCNASRKKLSVRSIQKEFLSSLRRSNIYKPATCYSLRHTYATNLGKDGVDLKEIQHKLGHKLSETSKKYLKLAEKKELDIKKSIKKLIRL